MLAKLRKEFSIKVREQDVVSSIPENQEIISLQINGFILKMERGKPSATSNGTANVHILDLIDGTKRDYHFDLPCAISKELIISYGSSGVYMLDVKSSIIYRRPWNGNYTMFSKKVFIIGEGKVMAYERETGKQTAILPNKSLKIRQVLAYYGDHLIFSRKEKNVSPKIINYYCINYVNYDNARNYILSVDMTGVLERDHVLRSDYLIIQLKRKETSLRLHYIIDLKEMKWIRTINCPGDIIFKDGFYVQRLEGKNTEKNIFYNEKGEIIDREGFGRFFGGLFVALEGKKIIFKDIKRNAEKEILFEESIDKKSVFLFQAKRREWIIVHKTIVDDMEDRVEVRLYELITSFDAWRKESFWFLPSYRQRDVILALWARRQRGCLLGDLPWELFLGIMSYI